MSLSSSTAGSYFFPSLFPLPSCLRRSFMLLSSLLHTTTILTSSFMLFPPLPPFPHTTTTVPQPLVYASSSSFHHYNHPHHQPDTHSLASSLPSLYISPPPPSISPPRSHSPQEPPSPSTAPPSPQILSTSVPLILKYPLLFPSFRYLLYARDVKYLYHPVNGSVWMTYGS